MTIRAIWPERLTLSVFPCMDEILQSEQLDYSPVATYFSGLWSGLHFMRSISLIRDSQIRKIQCAEKPQLAAQKTLGIVFAGSGQTA